MRTKLDLEWYGKPFEDFDLQLVAHTEKILAVYLKKPGSRTRSTLILFTPEGIILTGDLWSEPINARGYGLSWFTSKLHPSYLAEKFLKRTELRRDYIKEVALEQAMEEEDEYKKKDLLELAEWSTGESEYDILYKIQECIEEHWDYSWYDYPEMEMNCLAVVQNKFAELFPSFAKENSIKLN